MNFHLFMRLDARQPLLGFLMLILLGGTLSGCSLPWSRTSHTKSRTQQQILDAQENHVQRVEVVFTARVKKMLPDDTRGLPHQRFLLELDNSSTVLVAHNIKSSNKIPIQEGDIVTIKGEYIWNERGGVVHWTHHSNTPKHEGGYIEYGGSRYD